MNLCDSSRDPARPEVVISAALYLLSSYGCKGGCPKLAHVILRHLQLIAQRTDVDPVVAATCTQLCEQWEENLQGLLRQPSVAVGRPRPSALPTHPLLGMLSRRLH